jgi:periplasmic protein TonB
MNSIVLTNPYYNLMRIVIFTGTILCLLTTQHIQAQVEKQPAEKTVDKNATEKTDEEKQEYLFTKIEINAYTDRAQWDEHIRKSTILPDNILKGIPSGTYPVLVRFIVNTKGKVSDIVIEDDPGYGLGQRAVKVIQSYRGVWKPAIQCGRQVNSYKKQPVTFIVR